MANFNVLFKGFKNILKKELAILWIFSILLGFALIVLQIKHKLPLGKGDFVFISILALCVALYRPRWIFFLFVSLVPLENIILVSGFLPLQLRPYQFIGAILAFAVIILWLSKRLNFKLLKPSLIDWLLILLVPLSFFSIVNSPNKGISLKNNLILFSFVVLFYLVRNFIQKKEDLLKTAFFFLGSNLVVLGYGFYQVFADKLGMRTFEVMFGRPNSVFMEADWLGIFLCFGIAFLLSSIDLLEKALEKYVAYALIFFNSTLLILTLSRSAWIGATAIIFFYLLFNLYKKNRGKTVFTPQEFANKLVLMLMIFLFSMASIYFGKLSKFDIFDRARSTATGEQKITIACENSANIPRIISSTDELAIYKCQHINLEDIALNKSQGRIVTEIFQKDPSVMTRSQIYKKSFEIIREHPVLGVGFGTITQSLGTDERGAGLNESNIFLQVWSGSGILGLLAFIAVIIYLLIFSFRRISPICPLNKIIGCPIAMDDFKAIFNLFLLLGIIALIVPNLFNAGLLMGVLWFGLAIFASLTKSEI